MLLREGFFDCIKGCYHLQNFINQLLQLRREALAPSNIMRTPKYWMEDWKSRWDELGRCGMRQWTWDVPGTHSAREW